MTTPDVQTLLDNMTSAVRERMAGQDYVMVGIHSGGVWVAKALHAALELEAPLGELSIAFYRDDFSRIGMHPHVRPSHLPFEIENQHILLVDDVLYTGRTVRAALNEIFDFGRPASVTLAVLVDRGGRELPVHAEVIGTQMTLKPGEHVKLTGPDPLTLVIKQTR